MIVEMNFSVCTFTVKKSNTECIFSKKENGEIEEWMDNIAHYIDGVDAFKKNTTRQKVKIILTINDSVSLSETLLDIITTISKNDWNVMALIGNENEKQLVCVKQTIDITTIFKNKEVYDQYKSIVPYGIKTSLFNTAINKI